MLKKILIEAAKSHNFSTASENVDPVFFSKKEGRAERYLIITIIDQLPKITDLQQKIVEMLPESLNQEPSFNKNCDLVLLYRLEKLSDFKKIEDIALEYEEDPYHFKKYFLYYSEAEERAVAGKEFEDFSKIIVNMKEFDDYKKDPLKPSFYSLAARTFIKLPFLAVPRSQKILQTLSDSIAARLGEEKLDNTLKTLLKTENKYDVELISKDLINEELENIKNKNPGI